MKKVILSIIFCFILFGKIDVWATEKVEDKIIIVIDPGHGGSNPGANYSVGKEKNLTIKVAETIKEELDRYDALEVYLTRNDDSSMGLDERVEFAVDRKADMFISLHFNASEKQNVFGSEVWISCFDECYSESYPLANCVINELSKLGIDTRGIKTKENEDNQDFYGIIRHATENELPAMIIEHCFADCELESVYCDSDEKLIELGKADANAIAKYYGLIPNDKNENDYIYEPQTTPVLSDKTEPYDFAFDGISIDEVNGSTKEIKVKLSAVDKESKVSYYTYSLDNGENWTELLTWGNLASTEVTIQMDTTVSDGIMFRVYNSFDLYCESEKITLDDISKVIEEKKKKAEEEKVVVVETSKAIGTDKQIDYVVDSQKDTTDNKNNGIVKIAGVAVILIVLCGCVVLSTKIKRKKRRRK